MVRTRGGKSRPTHQVSIPETRAARLIRRALCFHDANKENGKGNNPENNSRKRRLRKDLLIEGSERTPDTNSHEQILIEANSHEHLNTDQGSREEVIERNSQKHCNTEESSHKKVIESNSYEHLINDGSDEEIIESNSDKHLINKDFHGEIIDENEVIRSNSNENQAQADSLLHDTTPVNDIVILLPLEEIENDCFLETNAELNTGSNLAAETSAQSSPTKVGKAGRKKDRILQKRVVRKLLKQSGKEYTGANGKLVSGRKLRPGCNLKCYHECHKNFSNEERESIFSNFWALESIQKKEFILRNVRKNPKKTQRVGPESKRKFTRDYLLPKRTLELVKVCRCFFMATLDVIAKFLRYTEEHTSPLGSATKDLRGRGPAANKTPPQTLATVRIFIEGLPAVYSHYCRNSSRKKYLPEYFETLSKLYRKYKEYCLLEKYSFVSSYVFKTIFRNEYNIGFHVPKKDKCDLCVKYNSEENHTPEEIATKKIHDAEREAVERMYLSDQQRAKNDPSFVTSSFDLEKVLTTPKGKSILFFYARKYAVYNLTFYESGSRKGFCYIWGEHEGKRGPNEICSILEMYLLELEERKTVKEVVLYCDNCAGQQKNKMMFVMLVDVIQRLVHIKKITIRFLIAGHTMMTVDSIHATIERATKYKTVYAPSEWLTLIANARFDPFPFLVIKLDHTNFRDWKKFSENGKLLTGFGSPLKTSEIRTVEYSKEDACNNVFRVFNEELNRTEIKAEWVLKRKKSGCLVEPAYREQLPISTPKFIDLNRLCLKKAIPPHFHSEYECIPHSQKTRDALPEPDEEEHLPKEDED